MYERLPSRRINRRTPHWCHVKQDLDSIGLALGRLPSGCCILTVAQAGVSTGMLCSWVQQAAFEPPSVTVCLKQGRPAALLVDASSRFMLNLIAEDPTEMFRHFGRGYSLTEDAFAGLSTQSTDFGPVLSACIAHLGCSVTQKVPVGDHDLYIATVRVARVTAGAQPYVHVRRSGLSY